MKKLLIITCAVGLLFGSTGVASADVGAKKVTKKENTFISDHAIFSVEQAIVCFENEIPVLNVMAVMPESTFIPEGNVLFVDVKKSVYRDPDVDRKWIWYYSVITNS